MKPLTWRASAPRAAGVPDFAVVPTLTGAEVIDAATGRTLAERPSAKAAGYVLWQLKSAGDQWPSVLCSLRPSYHAQDAADLVVNPSDPSGTELVSGRSFDDPELSLLHGES